MKERPVIFNGEMIRALLDGRKTQARRVMKAQPECPELGLRHIVESTNSDNIGKYFWSQSDACGANKSRSKAFPCPFGQVGDRLWVREAFGTQVRRDGLGGTGEFNVYRASNPSAVKYTTACGKSVPVKWTPSIYRKAFQLNRIWLTAETVELCLKGLQGAGHIRNVSLDDGLQINRSGEVVSVPNSEFLASEQPGPIASNYSWGEY